MLLMSKTVSNNEWKYNEDESHNKPDHPHQVLAKGNSLTQLVSQPHNFVCCTLSGMDSLCCCIFHTSSFPPAFFVLKGKKLISINSEYEAYHVRNLEGLTGIFVRLCNLQWQENIEY
jgi:hypothetical protein